MTTQAEILKGYEIGKKYVGRNKTEALNEIADKYGSAWLFGELGSAIDDALSGWDPLYVTGTRLGDIPASGRSYNYAENCLEAGVSMATVDGYEDVWHGTSATFIKAQGRPVIRVGGYLLAKPGSDNEYLVIGATKL